jgi:hypothetical protein
VDGRANFAHGHFSERILSQQLPLRKRPSSHFYKNLGPATLARVKYDGIIWGGKLKRWRRNLRPSNNTAAKATINNETNCCQSMEAR